MRHTAPCALSATKRLPFPSNAKADGSGLASTTEPSQGFVGRPGMQGRTSGIVAYVVTAPVVGSAAKTAAGDRDAASSRPDRALAKAVVPAVAFGSGTEPAGSPPAVKWRSAVGSP